MIATKVHGRTMPGENGRGLSRKHVMASIDGSLQRLGMDYVDLYQIHRWDPLTPIAETMEALHDVVKAGKARYIGASSMFAWQFAKAQAAADRAGDDALRLDAEPLQPRLPRGGAGDDPAVHRPARRRDAVEPARARAADGEPHTRGRAADDALTHRSVRRLALRRRGLRRRRPGLPMSRPDAACRRPRSRSRGCSDAPA